MSRRYTVNVRCSHDGCSEGSFYEYTTRRDERDARKRLYDHPWRCVRHTRPDEVLSPTNLRRETVIVNGKSVNYPDLVGLFWAGATLSSGFSHGLGWKAYADDFPPGTQIRVTAEVILPSEDDDER